MIMKEGNLVIYPTQGQFSNYNKGEGRFGNITNQKGNMISVVIMRGEWWSKKCRRQFGNLKWTRGNLVIMQP